jgi:8-oxo-dGTP diphosphatase
MLKAARNQYRGVFVGEAHLPDDDEAFVAGLAAALPQWQTEGIRVAWLQLPATRAALVPRAIEAGFDFHHCDGSRLMLVKRLEAGAYAPSGATHTVGVGGAVISDDGRVLVVLERRDVTARPGYYKLPGGMLEPGEYFGEGVVREVHEETGIRAVFDGVVSLRHHHKGQFGTSNLYVVCRLRPLDFEITVDDEEIGDAMWVDIEDYLANPEIGLYNKRVVRAAAAGRTLSMVEVAGYMSPGEYEVFLDARDGS